MTITAISRRSSRICCKKASRRRNPTRISASSFSPLAKFFAIFYNSFEKGGFGTLHELIDRKEKKVEYIELIYDLIFVYIIGRNNSLLHGFSGGFVEPAAFAAYVMTTLAVIQIWNYSTYYINIYGRHSAREHVFLFVNMFLLFAMIYRYKKLIEAVG